MDFGVPSLRQVLYPAPSPLHASFAAIPGGRRGGGNPPRLLPQGQAAGRSQGEDLKKPGVEDGRIRSDHATHGQLTKLEDAEDHIGPNDSSRPLTTEMGIFVPAAGRVLHANHSHSLSVYTSRFVRCGWFLVPGAVGSDLPRFFAQLPKPGPMPSVLCLDIPAELFLRALRCGHRAVPQGAGSSFGAGRAGFRKSGWFLVSSGMRVPTLENRWNQRIPQHFQVWNRIVGED